VGLGQLATIGVIRDPRVRQASELLARLYGGRPINALDALLLPPLTPIAPSDDEQQLAARLPTFYAGQLVPAAAAAQSGMLRALIEKGVALPHRMALAKAQLSPEQRAYYARARLELAQNYWRNVDIDELVGLLKDYPGERSEQLSLLLALGLALRGGPANAAEMMVKAPLSELGIGKNTAALDAIADGGGALAGIAAYDAAIVRHVAAPQNADAAYWSDLAKRFRSAKGKLVDVRHKNDAERRAAECEQIAAFIDKSATDKSGPGGS
jgi:hypothetical protein